MCFAHIVCRVPYICLAYNRLRSMTERSTCIKKIDVVKDKWFTAVLQTIVEKMVFCCRQNFLFCHLSTFSPMAITSGGRLKEQG